LAGKTPVTAGTGCVAIVCGAGDGPMEASQEAYSALKKLYTPFMYARTDIGSRFYKHADELQSRGYVPAPPGSSPV